MPPACGWTQGSSSGTELTPIAAFRDIGYTMKGLILLLLTIAVLAALGADLVFYRGFRANTPVPPW